METFPEMVWNNNEATSNRKNQALNYEALMSWALILYNQERNI